MKRFILTIVCFFAFACVTNASEIINNVTPSNQTQRIGVFTNTQSLRGVHFKVIGIKFKPEVTGVSFIPNGLFGINDTQTFALVTIVKLDNFTANEPLMVFEGIVTGNIEIQNLSMVDPNGKPLHYQLEFKTITNSIKR